MHATDSRTHQPQACTVRQTLMYTPDRRRAIDRPPLIHVHERRPRPRLHNRHFSV
jgi:hypothetical protein